MSLALQPLKTRIFQFFLISMDKRDLSDNSFNKMYEGHEKETNEDFIKRYSSTETELRETIAYLIHHRQLLKDAEIEKLEAEAANLVKKLRETKVKILLEELECFKEVLALHKRLLQKNGKPGK